MVLTMVTDGVPQALFICEASAFEAEKMMSTLIQSLGILSWLNPINCVGIEVSKLHSSITNYQPTASHLAESFYEEAGHKDTKVRLFLRIWWIIRSILEDMKNASEKVLHGIKEHPVLFIQVVVAVAAIVAILYPTIAAIPALVAGGFGPAGITAESLASMVHGAIGDVAAKSLFAILQSAGAGGYGVAAVQAVVQAAAGSILCADLTAIIMDFLKRYDETKRLETGMLRT